VQWPAIFVFSYHAFSQQFIGTNSQVESIDYVDTICTFLRAILSS